MKFALTAATAGAVALGGAATAATVVVYDPVLEEKFDDKRAIVDYVQETYGETAVYEDPDEAPADLREEIVPGDTFPAEKAGA